MKKNNITFLIAELILAIVAAFFIYKIFEGEAPQKSVAVILQNSGDSKWDTVINGLKQSAKDNNIHLIICNTDDIESAEEERELISEQLANDVDAFIICPAPGSDTKSMLKQACVDVPYILINEDIYSDNNGQVSGIPTVKVDHYNMGKLLGEQLAKDDPDILKDKKIGIITGRIDTDAGTNRLKGLRDALEQYDCTVSWDFYQNGEYDPLKVVDVRSRVDYLVVMDNEALENIGEKAEEGRYNGACIYGVGSSMKAMSLLDCGKVYCIAVTDGYAMGYDSVMEIAHKLDGALYTMASIEEDVKIIHREDIFTEDIERFLYSYE